MGFSGLLAHHELRLITAGRDPRILEPLTDSLVLWLALRCVLCCCSDVLLLCCSDVLFLCCRVVLLCRFVALFCCNALLLYFVWLCVFILLFCCVAVLLCCNVRYFVLAEGLLCVVVRCVVCVWGSRLILTPALVAADEN